LTGVGRSGAEALPSLRVAMVCPYSLSRPGGVQGQAIALTRALVERGHDVVLFAPVDSVDDRPVGVELVAAGSSVSLPANGSQAPVSLSPRAAWQALRVLGRGDFDVVHVHEPFAPGLPYGLLASSVPPLVATFHRSGPSAWYSLLRPLTRRLAHRFAVRCAVSQAARDTAVVALGGSYEVLFNGIDVARYERAVPWPTKEKTILFLGRHEERKGLDVLLKAFTHGPSHTGAVLWIAGDGPRTEQLRYHLPATQQVEWLGVLSEEEKLRRLAAADVLCAPSRGGESFGMILLGAMAARTLVVASDIDGYRTALGGSGVLVPPNDPDALAAGIGRLLDDGGLRTRIGSAGRERVVSRFTWQVTARGTAACYRAVLEHRPAAGVPC